MSHGLSVPAFPESAIAPLRVPSPTLSPHTVHDPKKTRRRGVRVAPIHPVSAEQSWKDAQLNDDELDGPCSPMIFRRPVAWPRAGGSAASTKASIAAMGIPRESPAPTYDLLWSSSTPSLAPTYTLSPQGYPNQHIPPRSSSLPSSHTISIYDTPRTMSRSPTPSRVDDDRCSEQMVFAERSPDEPQFGSASKPGKRNPPSSTRRAHAESSSMASRPTSALAAEVAPRAWRYDMDDVMPYSLLGAGPGMVTPGFPVHFVSPTPRTKPKPKPKAKAKGESRPTTAQPEGSVRLGFKKMKRLATRRSISSIDFLGAPPETQSQGSDPTASSSTLSVSEQTLERTRSIVSSGASTLSGDDEGEERAVRAHKVVGDVWEPQDLGQVIPALRSLKVSGKFGF